MAKERLSKLQKDILITLYREGKTTDMLNEYSKEENKGKIAELKKQGYKFGWKNKNPLIPEELCFTKKVIVYELKRLALLFKVYNWQKYNAYKEGWYGFSWWRGYPKGYLKKQVSFTRSLRNLCGKRLIDLMGGFGAIQVYDKELAKKLGIEPNDFEKEKEEAFEKEKEYYKKVKGKNPEIGTFKEWWTKSFMGGPTRKSIWESWHNSRINRNVKKIRLTPDGIKKARELLIVKS